MQFHLTINLTPEEINNAIATLQTIQSAVFPTAVVLAATALAATPPAAAPAAKGPGRPKKADATPATPAAPPAPAVTRKDLEALAAPLIQRGMINDLREAMSKVGANPPKLDNVAAGKYAELAVLFKQLDEPATADDGLSL